MRARSLSLRISVKDADKAREAFKALGADGERYLRQIDKALAPPNRGLIAFRRASNEAKDAVENMARNAGSAGHVLQAFGTKGLIAAAGIGAVTLAITKGLRAYAEEERAQLRLQSVMRTTGNAAKVTAGQIDELADRLERGTFFKKEDILQAAGALTTFKAVSGDAFESTIRLATDMAEVFGGDVVSNARMLGKALQDPVGGLTALKRVAGELPENVRLTAEALEKAGRHGDAVNVIIGELEKRLGGAAQDAASGYAGEINNLGDAFDDMFKSVGQLVLESGLETYLRNLGYGIDAITGAIKKLKGLFTDKRSRTEWQAFSAEHGYVTAPTVVTGYTFDSKGNLVPPKPEKPPGLPETKAKLDAYKEYLRSLEEENRLIRLTNRERAITEKVLKAENIARREGKKLTAEQRAEIEKQAAAIYDFTEAQEKAEEQAKKLAEAQKEMWKPVRHAFENIQDSLADMIVAGDFSARSLVSIFKRAAAEIAAAMIIRPAIGNMFGGLMPGISGSVTGGSVGGAGSLFSLSGLSSIGSGLLNGFTTPLINPGIAFDIGSALGLSGTSVGYLHQALGNFTPLSGIAGFAGSALANVIGLSGKYSGITGSLGGIAGTALFGPVGALAGSFLGSALGGFGGKPHPGASFEGRVGAGGGLDVFSLLSKHMGTEGPAAAAQQLSAFLSGIAQAGGINFRPASVQGIFDPGGARFRLRGESAEFGFNPNDASSVASAMRSLTVYLAETSGVVDNVLLDALKNVNTAGRDAAGVLQAVASQLGYIKGLKEFSDALLRDPSTTNLSPEEQRKLSQQFFLDTARSGTADLSAVQSAALAFLQSSQGYAGRASGVYAGDLSAVQAELARLIASPPRFHSGGEFIVNPGEIVMTSRTSGKVFNPQETKEILRGGNDALTLRMMTAMIDRLDRLIAMQRQGNSALMRAVSA